MILERRSLIRSLGAAAVVVAADYLLVLTDCIIAGRVIGEAALGAMNLLMPAFSVATFFAWLLGSGMSATYLRAVRKGDGRHAAEIAWQGLSAACVLAFVLGLLVWVCGRSYLSFMGPNEEVAGFALRYGRWYPAILAFQSIGMVLLYLVFVRGGELVCIKAYAVQLAANTILSYWLCERLGMAGIALGTALSYLVWGAAMAVLLKREDVGLRIVRVRFDPRLIARSVRGSFAESFVWLFHAVLFFGITKYVLLFWDSESLAVCAVVFFVIRLTAFFAGVGIAMRTLESSRQNGAADSSEIGKVFRVGASAAFVATVLAAAIFFVAPEPVIGLFGIESSDLVEGSKFAARVTVVGLVLGALASLLPLAWRVKRPRLPEARLNYLQSYVLSRIAADPSSQMFNLAKLFRLRKGIDLGRLSASLVAAGEAHGALRTSSAATPTGRSCSGRSFRRDPSAVRS